MALSKTKIGLFYNLAKDFPIEENYSGDLHFEWDNRETIDNILESLNELGYEVFDFGNPNNLLKENISDSIDIVFSICEMQGYRFRESIVPVLCEFLKLPYTFSPPDTLMISLDKNLCNLLLQQNQIPIPESYCFDSILDIEKASLKNYPYFVKPSCEGSGIGISEKSVIHSKLELENQMGFLLDKYRQPALVQKYLPNEDITIGVLEKDNQIIPLTPLIGKIGSKLSPIPTNTDLFEQVIEIAMDSFRILKCRDIARIDLKLSEKNEVYFLEMNPLPLLTKDKGYFMESANFSGYSYEDVLKIVIANAEIKFRLDRNYL